MKRLLAVLLTLTLLLALAGCGKQETPEPSPAPAPAPTVDPAPQPEPEPEPEPKTWQYAIRTETYREEATREEDGLLLAYLDYEYPLLTVTDEQGAAASAEEIPAEMATVCEAFNQVIDTSAFGEELEELREMSEENCQLYEENGTPEYFSPCFFESTLDSEYRRGDLLSCLATFGMYFGGVHPMGEWETFNFDLAAGEYFTLADLTDEPEQLRSAIAEEVIAQIYEDSEWLEGYFYDFEDTLRAQEDFTFYFDDAGLHVCFGEYEIAPHAMGLLEFAIPGDRYAGLLNERGRRLLDLPEETYILADLHEAETMWYWFEGGMPLDYDDTTTGADNDMDYCRVDVPGVTTLRDLEEVLATRFTPELVERRITSVGPYYIEEMGGVLYAIPAGRGSDMTIASVDYRVERSGEGGRVLAEITRQDYDEASEDWVLTGVVDEVAFPFTLTDHGAVFSDFQTIW